MDGTKTTRITEVRLWRLRYMKSYRIKKEDILGRICFIIKLVQNQNDVPMLGLFASKTDSMGGICDRFINTLSDTLVFDKILFENYAFQQTGNRYRAINDYYYYNISQARIAPDVIGVKVNDNSIPFAVFNNGWEQVPGTPKIEVKSFKAKDQMISLRNQDYDYIVLVDLSMRVDYLVPFINQGLFNQQILDSMQMDDAVFIVNDDNNYLSGFEEIDFSDDEIGEMRLLAVTRSQDFMNQATWCAPHVSIWRIKDITKRKKRVVQNLINLPLSHYVITSPRIPSLFEFNDNWKREMRINPDERILDFHADNIQEIRVLKKNNDSVVITTDSNNCSINGKKLEANAQYTVQFAMLNRSDSSFEEYFIQKECAEFLNSHEEELVNEILRVTSNATN